MQLNIRGRCWGNQSETMEARESLSEIKGRCSRKSQLEAKGTQISGPVFESCWA